MNEANVEIAVAVLREFIADPNIKRRLDPRTVSWIVRARGLNRKELKEARQRLDIKTVNENGVHIWILPEASQ